ncbi:amidase family protein, partial [Burkholderia pseudomallei]
MSELLDLSACSLAERFKNRSVTPVDYAHALLDHIARWEPHLNALCRFDPARVRDEALASTRRWAAGAPLSEIDGVPVTIKELIATQ